MSQKLSVSAAASFTRTIVKKSPADVLEYHIKGLVHVHQGTAPVTGLSAEKFTVRIGGQNIGTAAIAAHPEPDKFPGIYTLAINVNETLGGFAGFDWLGIYGLVLAVRVDHGADYGLAVASITQMETSFS